MSRLTVFWTLHLIGLAFFAGGLWLNFSIWLQGSIDGRASPGLWAAIQASWRFVWRAGLRRTLRTFLVDGLSHRRFLHESPGRWFAHAALMGSLGVLSILSIITGFCEEILILLFKVHHPIVEAIVNKDTPIMALANEALGLIAIIALAFLVVRRYVQRPAQLRTEAVDTVLVVLLAVILVSGYPTEVLRLLKDGVGPELGWYSFIGYPLSLPFRSLNWPWEALHYWTFLFHSLLASAVIGYIPFSKVFHAVVSPAVATANSLAKEAQAA